jgi:transposase
MPWDEADRAKYEVIRDRYSTDMSDAEFELILPLLPAPKKLGRKPTDFRVVLNAVFYMIGVSCPWRLLPKDFPPFTTVQNRFYAWRDIGLWPQIISVFVMAAREAQGREPAPTAVVVDSQSVKTTEAVGPRGFDSGKKIKGRKRHVAVDMLGLPTECRVTAASVQDRDVLAPMLGAVHRKSPWVTMSFVDGGYQGDEAQRAAFEASRISITVVKRTDKQVTGFIVLPNRWGRRKNTVVDQSRATPVEGFRGDNRILARMAATGPCFPPHAKAGQSENRLHLNFESDGVIGVSAEG